MCLWNRRRRAGAIRVTSTVRVPCVDVRLRSHRGRDRGHNIIGFDLPFIFQRCLAHDIAGQPLVSLAEYSPRGVYDTIDEVVAGRKESREPRRPCVGARA